MGNSMPVVGGIFQAAGNLMEADSKESQLKDEAIVSNQNAKVSREAGAYDAARQEIIGGKKIGEMKADYAASGISQDSGSVLDVLRESHTNAELDKLQILYGAESRARGFDRRARAAGRGAQGVENAGIVNAFGSMFNAGGKADSYYGGSSKAGGSNSSDSWQPMSASGNYWNKNPYSS